VLKKRFFLLFCCVLFLFTACTLGETPVSQQTLEEPQFSERVQLKEDVREGIWEHLTKLCSEEMEGREAGKRGEAQVALYLARFLQTMELKPAGDEDTYFQTFSINEYEPKLQGKRIKLCQIDSFKRVKSENILGILEGKEPEIMVISAHYDHLGKINGEIYSGANDNASGVSAVLEIIRKLAGTKPQKTLLFAFWGAEEKGLLGSQYFCTYPTVDLQEIKGVINLDTVGNLQEDKRLLGWLGGESELTQEWVRELAQEGWQISWEKPNGYNSDHASFAKKGIPGFTLLSPTWLENNHTAKDLPQNIKTDSLAELVSVLLKILK
jgi:aminopeptidase YwaD